ncbi:Saccharopine dehydrogenase-domain-containing protein [Desarmillaria tabescens]|uniref:Saccharopine dehydrogenase-domain-containing protein n=1 Tax=Armillaria tabescens TaxID=1929756 RepID=A0AA39KDR6_ARMTA|nr:Saccharopine dehydrogenase-domain-containing protein [Desarmillaria tabescens]KAK0459235.1 Saccharopine dehydrogenase-domain-containing protein [Desarmillaria tabescens]
MNKKTDLLVLGATGITGRQTVRYLCSHLQRSTFTFSIAGRRKDALDAIVAEFSLPESVDVLQVDVTKPDQVEAAVKTTKVVINTVGPYWTYGTPVVRACVQNGIHYVDLTGEPFWVKDIIQEFDYFATKTGSIIVPTCGMDCIPSDLCVYLASKTLQGPIDNSTTAWHFDGTASGGSLATIFTMIEDVPTAKLRWAMSNHALSPVVGVPQKKPFKFVRKLHIPFSNEILVGGQWFMANVDRAIVQRTWGLLEYDAMEARLEGDSERLEAAEKARYGPLFTYDELAIRPNVLVAVFAPLRLLLGMMSLMISPIRFVVKKLLRKPGEGPTDAEVELGGLEVVNITRSGSSYAKTTFKGHGDPGYLLSCVMVVEAALCLLHPETIRPFARRGGVLTPASAMGDVLAERLNATGHIEIESVILKDGQDNRKTI